MHRRRFLTNSFATGLAAPVVLGPTSALANYDDDNPASRQDDFQHVSILLSPAGRLIVLTQLLIYANGLLLFYDLQRQWQRFAASRASLSKVPILGGLQHKPVSQRLEAMALVGSVFLLTTTLIIMATQMPRTRPKRVTVFNADNEFTTTTRAKTVKKEQFDRILKPAEKIKGSGAFFDKKTGELLARIPPEFVQR